MQSVKVLNVNTRKSQDDLWSNTVTHTQGAKLQKLSINLMKSTITIIEFHQQKFLIKSDDQIIELSDHSGLSYF